MIPQEKPSRPMHGASEKNSRSNREQSYWLFVIDESRKNQTHHFQRFSVSAFQRFSVSAFQRFSVSAFQRFSVSAFQLLPVQPPTAVPQSARQVFPNRRRAFDNSN
jgi:hypothetical protein